MTAHSESHSSDPARVRLSGPAAIAASLPYLLGEDPTETAVMAILNADNTVNTFAAKPLPEYPQHASPEVLDRWADEVGEMLAMGIDTATLRFGEMVALVLVVPGGNPSPRVSSRILAPLDIYRDQTLDVIAVFNDRWRSLLCRNPYCCDPAGQPLLDDPRAVAAVAELVGMGLAPTAAMELPEDLVQSEKVARWLPIPRDLSTFAGRREHFKAVCDLLDDPEPEFSTDQLADLVAAADRPGIRDALIVRYAKNFDTDSWQDQYDAWATIAGASPTYWKAGPSCLAAILAWRLGAPLTAAQWLDRALADNSYHRMAALLLQVFQNSIAASEWFDAMSAHNETDCLRFDRTDGS